MLDHVVLATIGASGLVASALLLAIPTDSEMETVLGYVGGAGFALSTLLLLRTVIKAVRRRG